MAKHKYVKKPQGRKEISISSIQLFKAENKLQHGTLGKKPQEPPLLQTTLRLIYILTSARGVQQKQNILILKIW